MGGVGWGMGGGDGYAEWGWVLRTADCGPRSALCVLRSGVWGIDGVWGLGSGVLGVWGYGGMGSGVRGSEGMGYEIWGMGHG